MSDNNILDDLFHGCAFTAFLEQASIEGGWPDPEATRIRAYRHYEKALAARSRDAKTHPSPRRHAA
jgi:hypothetical protein